MIENIKPIHKVKARKEHECMLCGLPIKKGETYYKQTNVDDGDIYDFKMHIHCDKIAIKYDLYGNYNDEGLTDDAFMDFIRQEFGIKGEEYDFKTLMDRAIERLNK